MYAVLVYSITAVGAVMLLTVDCQKYIFKHVHEHVYPPFASKLIRILMTEKPWVDTEINNKCKQLQLKYIFIVMQTSYLWRHARHQTDVESLAAVRACTF